MSLSESQSRVRESAIAIIATILLSQYLCGQPVDSPPAQVSTKSTGALSFDVASIKPSKTPPQGLAGIYTYPGGTVRVGLCPTDILIAAAFDVQTYQVVGGPKWIHTALFDIVAKSQSSVMTGGSGPRYGLLPEQKLMMQSLLEERFRLRYHRSTKVSAILVLEKGAKKLKIRSPKDPTLSGWVGSNRGGGINGDGLKGLNILMSELASRLSARLNRPVLDRTGTNGRFDFEYEYHSGDDDVDLLSSIITSLQEVGLNLKSDRGPMETIVIDDIDLPSEN